MLGGFMQPQSSLSPRLAMYDSILQNLRIVIIDKMAKPEEVIIVQGMYQFTDILLLSFVSYIFVLIR